MDAVLLLMPALVFVLTVCGAIHFTNYYLDASEKCEDHDLALSTAMRRGWLPCVLAEVTTAFGLGSLLVSELVPVRKFGFFSSVSMALIMLRGPGALARPFRACGRPRHNGSDPRPSASHWWRPLYLHSHSPSERVACLYLS